VADGDDLNAANGTILGEDGIRRCAWCAATPEYRAYHDTEWGFPVADDVRLFEKLSLEGFQAGLSWLTILRRREGFRRAFAGFDPPTVAAFGSDDVERLLADASIIRHRGKIEAVINNAARALDLIAAQGSLAHHVWSFAPAPVRLGPSGAVTPPSTTPESTALARDLRRRGWRFVGPTTAYAFMQSMGLVNDHRPACAVYAAVCSAREEFTLP
jgi:DNA-3-methyladenine glycosylase I